MLINIFDIINYKGGGIEGVNQGRELVEVGALRKEDRDFIEEIYVQKLKRDHNPEH